MAEYLLGIDLGGTNIKIGCFDKELNLIGKTSVPTGSEMSPEAIVEKFYTTSNDLLSDNGLSLDDVCSVGVGVPGIVDVNTGVIMACPNLPLFRQVPLKDMVSKRMGKPAIIENDANVACWAEYINGAGKEVDHMIMLTLGTGIGGGIICDGRLIHGPTGGAAELGHMIIELDGRPCGCGQKGCVEAYASASSTAARATEAVESGAESTLTVTLKENGEITCKDVFDHANNGDKLAKKIIEGSCRALGLICVQLANITDPQTIVFAGGMIAAGDTFLEQIKHYYAQYIGGLYQKGSLEICFATLGEDAGIIGAAALGLGANSD